ncbi:MAG: hypothetical protein HDR88_10020 [Bacteroides sp.]|nr:hypothetical protein [Bacteroides sp.]
MQAVINPQVINLTNQTGCKITTFPDGEKHVTVDELNRRIPVSVYCRITCADDLFCLMQVADVLKRQEMIIDNLFIGYLMSMRCDRLFDINRPFSLKLVAEIINSVGALQVGIVEPHSTTSLLKIKNSIGVMATMEFFYKEIARRYGDSIVAVLPDSGARSRYQPSSLPFIVCGKERDPETGRLLSFTVDAGETECKDKDLVVLDDLCDGGGTFVGLAPRLRELEPKSLSLLVTHAIQLEGIKKVAEAYDHVYITNSYKAWENEPLPENVTVFKVFK